MPAITLVGEGDTSEQCHDADILIRLKTVVMTVDIGQCWGYILGRFIQSFETPLGIP
jgi:hypothetical protein